MDVKDKLNQISQLKEELNEYFGGYLYEDLIDMTDEYWTVTDELPPGKFPDGTPQPFSRASYVGWSEESPLENPDIDEDDYKEHVYGDDVQSVLRKEDFTLICIYTSTGDGKQDLVFDNSKEIPESKLNP